MTTVEVAALITALGLGSAVPLIFTAVLQRKKTGADATAVVTAASRELVDPLRRELAQERADHAGEVEVERVKVRELRAELGAATRETHALRQETSALRDEMAQLRSEVARLRAENAAYRRMT